MDHPNPFLYKSLDPIGLHKSEFIRLSYSRVKLFLYIKSLNLWAINQVVRGMNWPEIWYVGPTLVNLSTPNYMIMGLMWRPISYLARLHHAVSLWGPLGLHQSLGWWRIERSRCGPHVCKIWSSSNHPYPLIGGLKFNCFRRHYLLLISIQRPISFRRVIKK